MKIGFILGVLVLMVALGGCKGEDQADAVSRETKEITASVDTTDDLQSVRLPNSNEMVFIEGISKEEAEDVDKMLRCYEKYDGREIDLDYSDGAIAWLYNPTRKIIGQWFDPSEAKNDSSTDFYFKSDEELGGYRMSESYYRTGYKRFLRPAPLENPND